MSEDILEREEMSKDISSFWRWLDQTGPGATGTAEAVERVKNTAMAGGEGNATILNSIAYR